MASKKIGVLGGGGFVGRYLVQHLAGNVIPVTRREVNLLDANATYDYLAEQQFDVVIGAAKHPEYPLADRTDIASTNLNLFTNVYAARGLYGRYINLGSGAEFDRRYNITNRTEQHLFMSMPLDGYGLSRNTISRICLSEEEFDFYTVRLFGVLHGSEQAHKLFRKLRNNIEHIYMKDSYFDYMSLDDIKTVIQYFVDADVPKYRDVNAVYENKLLLSEQVNRFKEIHGLTTSIHIDGPTVDYTGDGGKLKDLNLQLTGLEQGMKNYETSNN